MTETFRCKRDALTMEVTSVCKDCGHNSVFHRGSPAPNPALTECLACRVEIIWRIEQ
jgi:hypothetical protein